MNAIAQSKYLDQGLSAKRNAYPRETTTLDAILAVLHTCKNGFSLKLGDLEIECLEWLIDNHSEDFSCEVIEEVKGLYAKLQIWDRHDQKLAIEEVER